MPARARTISALLALVLALALSACGEDEKGGPGHAASLDGAFREGLAEPLEGVDYNVFITRQLNPRIPPDDAYYNGPAIPPGQTIYGVFLQACNNSDEPHQTARKFTVVDNQGNEFEPLELPEDNAFAYEARVLEAGECIPRSGSVAQLGPTAGSMLLFRLPVEATENRPLELEVASPAGAEKLAFELDL